MARSYVYCVATSEDKHFAEMTAVSAYLLRKADPQAVVHTLVDSHTAKSAPTSMGLLRQTSDQLHVHHIDSKDTIVRSRMLKIRARRIIEGAFLFLDTDTLPRSGIDLVFETEADIGLAPDPYPTPSNQVALYRSLEWGPIPSPMLNSGVTMWADTSAARELSETWEELYQMSIAEGVHADQPALNQALRICQVRKSLLDEKFNLLIRQRPLRVHSGVVLHINTGIGRTGFNNLNDTVLHVAAKELKSSGLLNSELLDSFAAVGDPWIASTSWKHQFGVKQYRAALSCVVKKLIGHRSMSVSSRRLKKSLTCTRN